MIKEPNLNCDHCYALKRDAKIKPRCENGVGCPIEDLASDYEITEVCSQFNIAKALYGASNLPASQERIFKKIGLFDNEYLWLSMEATYAQAERRRIQTAQAMKQK